MNKTNKNRLYASLVAILSASLLFTSALVNATAQPQEEYHVLGKRQTGSRIRPEIITSLIPLDKTYAELSETDKTYIRANYENMPADDEPPFPLKGLNDIWVPVGKTFQRNDQIGEVVAIASVNAEGKVEKVSMYKTTSTDITRMVSAALFATEFKPGLCSGEPCAMDFILEGRLNIELLRH